MRIDTSRPPQGRVPQVQRVPRPGACSIISLLSFALCELSTAVAHSPDSDPPPKPVMDVAVTVQVNDAGGAPITNAPIEAFSSIGGAFAFTDENGAAVVKVRTYDEAGYLWVTLSEGEELALPAEVTQQAKARFETLVSAYAFKTWISLPISAGQASAATEYIGRAPIAVTGVVTHSDGSLYQGAVGALGSTAYQPLPGQLPGGEFVLTGVPKSTPLALVIAGVGPQAHLIDLSAQQTAKDVGLGAIALAEAPRDADLELRFTNNIGLLDEPDPAPVGHEVCLVKSDGSIVLTLRIDRRFGTANVFSEQLDDEPGVMVPAGEYYVTPGRFGTRIAMTLFRLVQAGRQAELDTARVPKITLTAGQTTELSMDARAARDAILSLPTSGDQPDRWSP